MPPAQHDATRVHPDQPGIGRLGSDIIIAETGSDMAQFASAHHLACWIGVCPGQNESAWL
ncbi:transposase [Streptomyces hokutonensis]|uniref:transposase n=1 Tax=Streptomyces hokutonensis TaxID=1306990 RepID=UPI00369B0460